MIAPSDTPRDDLVRAVRQWLTLLAQSEWDAALAMLDEPNAYGISWTKERILAVVADTFSADTRFGRELGAPRFSDPGSASGDGGVDFGRADDGSFWLDCAVPLNGVLSDLTAQFVFLPRANGLAMVLHDLHVM